MTDRIQKVMSDQGYCSRRAAEALIRAGRVTVNGHRVSLGDRIDVARDVLAVDGQRVYLRRRPEKVYYMLNKPRGYVTTMEDRHAAKTVADLMSDVGQRVYPVGRLDKDSEGLLLLTNDGAFTNMVTHPSREVNKLYRVSVRPCPDEEQLIALSSNVQLDDGTVAHAVSVRLVVAESARGVMEITLNEGKNREIRRMCEAVGLEVIRLKRLAVGPLRLGMLKTGSYRELTKEELNAIRGACRKKEK